MGEARPTHNLTRMRFLAGQDSVFLVFEYCDHDLAALLDSSQTPPFSEAEIKRLMVTFSRATFWVFTFPEEWETEQRGRTLTAGPVVSPTSTRLRDPRFN